MLPGVGGGEELGNVEVAFEYVDDFEAALMVAKGYYVLLETGAAQSGESAGGIDAIFKAASAEWIPVARRQSVHGRVWQWHSLGGGLVRGMRRRRRLDHNGGQGGKDRCR